MIYNTDSQDIIECHPLDPFLPEGARVMMLGSFPPPRARWSMDFYYPNMQNDMWRIMGLVFFGDKEHFLSANKKMFCEEKIRDFLTQKGIAIGDTAKEVIRHKGNASDQFLEVLRQTDFNEVLGKLPDCRTFVTTGQKATDVLRSLAPMDEPKVGGYSAFAFQGRAMKLYRMPSSSRAYPKPLVEKAEMYGNMFRELGLQ